MVAPVEEMMSSMRAKSHARAKVMARAEAVVATEPTSADDELVAYCPDLDHWPTSWRYEARDVAPGRQMVECFKPFLRHLLSLGLSRKTLCRHRDNLWLLGGAFHRDPRLRKRPIMDVMLQAIDEEGGPLICQGAAGEAEQRSFDATCLRFYRFLIDCNSAATWKVSGQR
jgi:hypothetical protein